MPVPLRRNPLLIAARDLVDGEVQVANITGSIAQGIVRFGDYEVRARAAISSDLLEVLLQQLVEGPAN